MGKKNKKKRKRERRESQLRSLSSSDVPISNPLLDRQMAFLASLDASARENFFDDALPYRVHRSEGALFLWLWFEGLPITVRELYERLKARDVLIVPGHYFFFGLEEEDWPHWHECIRVTFTMEEHVVREGFQIIAEEVAKAYAEGSAQGGGVFTTG